MPKCNALTGNILKSCEGNVGGISKIYIADFACVTTITEAGTPAEVTAIAMEVGEQFFEFETNRNTSSIEETVNIDITNGTTYFNQTTNLMLKRRDAVKRDAIEKLTAGQKKLRVIVLDSNGNYWLSGQGEGAYVTEISGGTGIAKGDSNGYDIVITAEESDQMVTVDPAIIPALLIPAI